MTDTSDREINAAALFEKCDEKYYSTAKFQTPETTVRDFVDEYDTPVKIELDIGRFAIASLGMGDVKILTTDETVIEYYNATKLHPFGKDVMQSEIEQSAYDYTKWIVTECIDHWIAVSETVEIVN